MIFEKRKTSLNLNEIFFQQILKRIFEFLPNLKSDHFTFDTALKNDVIKNANF